MKLCHIIMVNVVLFLTAYGQFSDPFSFEVRSANPLIIEVGIPQKHYLYADALMLYNAQGERLERVDATQAVYITDPVTSEPKGVFDRSFQAQFIPQGDLSSITIAYWGCNDTSCFIPQRKEVNLTALQARPKAMDAQRKERFALRAVGFLDRSDFLRFLDTVEGVETAERSAFGRFVEDPAAFVEQSGMWWALLFIMLGGLALNLTPCILPMIPVNLAIIGAGAQAGSRLRGFGLGATYGLGIALVYGLLGVIVVLTGSQFGTLQSNPWFNAAIFLLFLLLALAMFGVIRIDFSAFQKGGTAAQRGRFGVALSMGAVAALLAGACVAPVVIAVLLLATHFYQTQPGVALLLPFLLGVGMALPWPFAGAGLSFLPKPGRWMERIKIGFGILILLFAFYYGSLSWQGFGFTPTSITSTSEHEQVWADAPMLDETRQRPPPQTTALSRFLGELV